MRIKRKKNKVKQISFACERKNFAKFIFPTNIGKNKGRFNNRNIPERVYNEIQLTLAIKRILECKTAHTVLAQNSTISYFVTERI